jgi:putative transposase
MSNYHRAYTSGGTYFFTLVTHERRPILCSEQALARLRNAFRTAIKKFPFLIEGIVILPDHLHCIWKLPENDSDFSKRWTCIKHYFSTGMTGVLNQRREKEIWQKRFWEHLVRDEEDFLRCLEYIYYNPVKHGYVASPFDWLWSSFRRDVRKGLFEKYWGSCEPSRIKNLEME